MSKINTIKQVNQSVTIGYECDICGLKHNGNSLPNSWHSFGHHHQDWGNDSIDSNKYFHVCSIGCYTEQLKNCLNSLEDHKRTAEIDEMSYEFAQSLYDRIK